MLTAVYPSSLFARAIEAYQRFISPYKGFRCAHRALHGRDSCSQFARRVAVKRGVLAMFALLRRRFTECGVAAQVLDYEMREKARPDRKESASSSSRSSCDADGCHAADCASAVPSNGCGHAGGIAEAASAPADCAGGADCASADCVSCDVL